MRRHRQHQSARAANAYPLPACPVPHAGAQCDPVHPPTPHNRPQSPPTARQPPHPPRRTVRYREFTIAAMVPATARIVPTRRRAACLAHRAPSAAHRPSPAARQPSPNRLTTSRSRVQASAPDGAAGTAARGAHAEVQPHDVRTARPPCARRRRCPTAAQPPPTAPSRPQPPPNRPQPPASHPTHPARLS